MVAAPAAGRPAPTGDIASGRRVATARDSASSGRNPRPTANQIRTPSNGIEQRQRKERAQRGLGGDLAALVERMRDLQRVIAVDMRIDAPRVPVLHDVGVAFRDRDGQSGARLRPVDEHAVAVPDLGDDLGHARRAPAVARRRRRRAPAQQVLDARRVRELLQLQVEELSDFAPGFDIRGERGQRRHGPEAQQAAGREASAGSTSCAARSRSPRRESCESRRRRASGAGCGRALRWHCFRLRHPIRRAAPRAAPWKAPSPGRSSNAASSANSRWKGRSARHRGSPCAWRDRARCRRCEARCRPARRRGAAAHACAPRARPG